MIIYSNTYQCSFHFDDVGSIVKNLSIRKITDLRAIWNFWPTRFITYFSIAFNYHINGLNLFGYHLFNIIVHIGSAILAWWLTLLTFRTPAMKNEKIAAHADIIALFIGLIFVAHPVQTQGVTYVIQRAASLATFFYLASLTLYIKSRLSEDEAHGRSLWKIYYAASIATAVIAMFTKEIAITLPFMALLYELCFLKGERGVNWRRLTPFLLTVLVIPLTAILTKSVNLSDMTLSSLEDRVFISPGQYLFTQFRVMVTYIRLLFIPLNQNVDYNYPLLTSFAEPASFLSLIFLIAILVAAIKIFPRYKLISFGVFWFFLTLLPESSIKPIRDLIFEHRLYLPMVGYGFFLVGMIYYIFGDKHPRKIAITLVIIVACYSVLTYNRNFVWKDKFSLWDDAVRKSPGKGRPYNDRGNAYVDKGDLDRAISDFNRSIELDPYDVKAYNNRGNAYEKKGDLDRAIADYNKAIEIKSNIPDIYNNRGSAYKAKGDLDRAIEDYNKAIEVGPLFADAYNNRGVAYGMKGEPGRAIVDFNKAIELDPGSADAYNNRGIAYDMKGEYDLSMADYARAKEIDPNYAKAYINMALAWYNKKEYEKSWQNVHKAKELNGEVNPQFLEKLKAVSRQR